MNTSILQIAIELANKICLRAEEGETRDLDIMAEEILNDCKGSTREILQVIIQYMGRELREDKKGRKELGLVIKEKDRPRRILTALGQIDFTRDYYFDKMEGRHTAVLDQPSIGLLNDIMKNHNNFDRIILPMQLGSGTSHVKIYYHPAFP